MAATIFEHELAERGLAGVAVSMGTLGIVGRAADPLAVMALAERGLDLRAHRSQGLGAGVLRHATAILVMEEAHKRTLEALDPQLTQRVELLGAHDPSGGSPEIGDPIGGTLDDFRQCRDRITRCIDAWLSHPGR
jgi:protein-tyrosine phosphatase